MGFGYTGFIGHTGGDPGVVSLLFFDPKSGGAAMYKIWDTLAKYQ